MNIAQSKTRTEFPLSTKKVIKKTIASSLTFTCISIIFWMFTASTIVLTKDSSAFVTGLVILSVLVTVYLLLTVLYQMWYYSVYFYDLTDDYVIIRKGPITPTEITIPYERIQDVYVDQDILDRIFGLYDVHFSSATVSSGLAAHIDGLEKKAADGLKEKMLKTVSEKISKRRVPTPPQY